MLTVRIKLEDIEFLSKTFRLAVLLSNDRNPARRQNCVVVMSKMLGGGGFALDTLDFMGTWRGEHDVQVTPKKLYRRMVDRRVRKLAPLWEARIGETALRLNAESWVRFFCGWLVAAVGTTVTVLTIWTGASGIVTVPMTLVVAVVSMSLVFSAVPVTKRHMKATTDHLGLPAKPEITLKAMQSPANFDIWLLETREYHHIMNNEK